MSIYILNQVIQQTIEAAIDQETGEILNNDLMERLEQLSVDKNELLLDLGCDLVNTKASIKSIEDQEKILSARKSRLKKHYEGMEKLLKKELTEGEKLSDGRVSLKWRKSSAVVIEDEDRLLESRKDLFKEKITYSPDKTLIKTLIKSGEEIDYCKIDERMNLVVE